MRRFMLAACTIMAAAASAAHAGSRYRNSAWGTKLSYFAWGSCSPEGEAPGAAILSLGFSLRLVDSLARATGGRLDIGHNALTLHLPSANSKAEVELGVQQGD